METGIAGAMRHRQGHAAAAARSFASRSSKLLAGAWLACALLAALPVAAATLAGKVVALDDGDSLVLLDASGIRYKVRLAGVDAPEHQQAFNRRAKIHLAQIALHKQAIVEWNKQDRYNRMVGKLLVDGQDAGLAQIEAGLAWHYKAYANEQSPQDRARYEQAEASARQARRGLWQQDAPQPPWEFRRDKRR
jgi:endonuclease YncB( thermonuclease family)